MSKLKREWNRQNWERVSKDDVERIARRFQSVAAENALKAASEYEHPVFYSLHVSAFLVTSKADALALFGRISPAAMARQSTAARERWARQRLKDKRAKRSQTNTTRPTEASPEATAAEVTHRPDINIHKRTLSETWSQVRRKLDTFALKTPAAQRPRVTRAQITGLVLLVVRWHREAKDTTHVTEHLAARLLELGIEVEE